MSSVLFGIIEILQYEEVIAVWFCFFLVLVCNRQILTEEFLTLEMTSCILLMRYYS